METKTNNNVCEIEYNPSKNCLYHTWKSETGNVKWDVIKDSFLKYVEYIENYKPEKVLVDERQMKHIFDLEEQEYIDKEIMPRILAHNTKKTAIVQSEDVYVEMATDMLMKQEKASQLQMRFFKNKTEADEWVNS